MVPLIPLIVDRQEPTVRFATHIDTIHVSRLNGQRVGTSREPNHSYAIRSPDSVVSWLRFKMLSSRPCQAIDERAAAGAQQGQRDALRVLSTRSG